MTTLKKTATRKGFLRMAAAAIALGVAASSIGLPPPPAYAQATKAKVDGVYQAAENAAIVNQFVVDIFGGLEVTPIRDGRRGRTVIYEKVSDGEWREAGLFRNKRATYQFTNSEALLWTSADGRRTYTLYRTGRDRIDVDHYVLQGRYKLNGDRRNYNVFRMTTGDTVQITPYRKGRRGGVVTYVRVDGDTFRERRGRATYTVLPSGDLLWESNDDRRIRISLSPR